MTEDAPEIDAGEPEQPLHEANIERRVVRHEHHLFLRLRIAEMQGQEGIQALDSILRRAGFRIMLNEIDAIHGHGSCLYQVRLLPNENLDGVSDAAIVPNHPSDGENAVGKVIYSTSFCVNDE